MNKPAAPKRRKSRRRSIPHASNSFLYQPGFLFLPKNFFHFNLFLIFFPILWPQTGSSLKIAVLSALSCYEYSAFL